MAGTQSTTNHSSPAVARPSHVVYIVTDTCYPTSEDFSLSKGTFNIDSVHSTKQAANQRAKKIMFQGGGQSKVDVDKIIEEVDRETGLYTGIGVGGAEDGVAGNVYARKCGVEQMCVDEDSEDEADEESGSSQEERKAHSAGTDGDVDMG